MSFPKHGNRRSLRLLVYIEFHRNEFTKASNFKKMFFVPLRKSSALTNLDISGLFESQKVIFFFAFQNRQSIKSSFRDKDKPSRFKDSQSQTTRFQVAPPNEEDSDDSSGSKEDRELLDNEYDTKYGKSFR